MAKARNRKAMNSHRHTHSSAATDLGTRGSLLLRLPIDDLPRVPYISPYLANPPRPETEEPSRLRTKCDPDKAPFRNLTPR